MGDVKFIRVHGHVVPVHTGAGAKGKNLAAGKAAAMKAGNGLKKQAIAKANDKFNDLKPNQQAAVKKGFKVFDNINQGAGLAAGAAALVGGLKLGKIGMKAVDHGIDAYAKKATDARKDYTQTGLIGSAVAGVWGASAAISHSKMVKSLPGLAAAKKFGSAASAADAVKIGSKIKNLKFGRNISLAVAGLGLVQAGIGAIGRHKAKKHEQRANMLKGISSQVKKFAGG